MPRIYAIGETIYDIIFKNDEPVAAKAGGSALNTTVSLGRLGLPIYFVSEYGYDKAGDLIHKFLAGNKVDHSLIYRYQDGKTAISMAFLNEQNEAKYSFYKIYPEERLKIDLPSFQSDDIILFGGFYSLMSEVRQQLMSFVRAASKAGAFILYDPNIRSPHKDEINELRALIYENINLARLVRGSNEDFKTILDISSGAEAYKLIKAHGCDYLVYTRSNVCVEIHHPDGMIEVKVPSVKTLSTIGAGDSFNAGLIYELFRSKGPSKDISAGILEKMARTAIGFGSHVCTHYENYITEEFASHLYE